MQWKTSFIAQSVSIESALHIFLPMDTANYTTTALLPDHNMDDSGRSVDRAGKCHYWVSPLDWDSDFCVPQINNPEYLALVNQACTISGPILDGVNAMIPRTFIRTGQTSAPVISLTSQEPVVRSHYRNEVHTEKAQDERPCTHDRGGPKTNNPDWDKWKPEIENLYMHQRLTLPVVVAEMKEKGFSAT
jgi:Clr5 domain